MSSVFERLRSVGITTRIAVLVVTALAIANIMIGVAVLMLYPPPSSVVSSGAAVVPLDIVAKPVDGASSPDQRAEIVRNAEGKVPDLDPGQVPQRTGEAIRGPQSEVGVRSRFVVAPGGPGHPPWIAMRPPDGGAAVATHALPPRALGAGGGLMAGRPVAMNGPVLVTGGAGGGLIVGGPISNGSAVMPSPGFPGVTVFYGAAPPPGFPGPGLGLIMTIGLLAYAVALFSIWAARALTAPLTQFTDAAERFTLGSTDAPLPEHGPREIVQAAHEGIHEVQGGSMRHMEREDW
jgi:hypothetical protein